MRMRIRSNHILISILTGVLLLSSCGSSDSKITKPEFLDKANALCKSLDERLAGAEADLGEDATEEQLLAFIEIAVNEIGDTVKDFRDLGFPEGDEAVLDELFSDVEDIVDQMDKDPAFLMTGSSESPFADVDAKFLAYGITECVDE